MPDINRNNTTQTIVVGYDGSEASRTALRVAARAASDGGRVVIVHAYQLPEGGDWPEYGRLLSERHDKGARLLDELPLGDPELAGPRYETELIGGPPARAIDVVARERRADQIFVGEHIPEGTAGTRGSLSEELRALANRPVTVVTSEG